MLTESLATVLAVASLAAATTNVRVNDSDCASYQIGSGDTLGKIARAEGVAVQDLIVWNTQIDNPDLIFPGERLCITPPVDPGDKTSVVDHVHEVTEQAVSAVVQAEELPGHKWDAYNKATAPTDGPQPGAIALRDAILERVPGTTDLGIYNPRKSRGSTNWSLHAEGRAVDIGLSCDGDDAFDLMLHLAYNAERLGIQRLLVCSYGWDNRQGLFEPSHNLAQMHTNPAHLHIGLNDDGGANLTHDLAGEVLSWLGS